MPTHVVDAGGGLGQVQGVEVGGIEGSGDAGQALHAAGAGAGRGGLAVSWRAGPGWVGNEVGGPVGAIECAMHGAASRLWPPLGCLVPAAKAPRGCFVAMRQGWARCSRRWGIARAILPLACVVHGPGSAKWARPPPNGALARQPAMRACAPWRWGCNECADAPAGRPGGRRSRGAAGVPATRVNESAAAPRPREAPRRTCESHVRADAMGGGAGAAPRRGKQRIRQAPVTHYSTMDCWRSVTGSAVAATRTAERLLTRAGMAALLAFIRSAMLYCGGGG